MIPPGPCGDVRKRTVHPTTRAPAFSAIPIGSDSSPKGRQQGGIGSDQPSRSASTKAWLSGSANLSNTISSTPVDSTTASTAASRRSRRGRSAAPRSDVRRPAWPAHSSAARPESVATTTSTHASSRPVAIAPLTARRTDPRTRLPGTPAASSCLLGGSSAPRRELPTGVAPSRTGFTLRARHGTERTRGARCPPRGGLAQ